MSITETLEKQVLVRCCVDPSYRSKARPVLETGGCFDDPRMSWVWRTILTLPPSEPVTRTALMGLVELAFREDPAKEERHVTMVDALFEHAGNGQLATLASVEVLGQLASYARLEKTVVEVGGLLQRGDLSGAWKRYSQLRHGPTEKHAVRRIDYAASVWDRLAAMMDQSDPTFVYIPTRIKGIDRYIDGLRLGELGLIVATTNRGKSITAMNFAAAAAMQGFVTAMFSTEMLIEQVAMRFDSHLTKLEHRKFKTWSFSVEEQERLAAALELRAEQLNRKLFLFDTPIKGCRLDLIETALLELEEDLGQPVREVVIDSPAHFESERRYEQKRFEFSNVFWDLKALARGEGSVEHPIAVWVTDQAAKEYEHRLAGAGATSESYDKSRIADVMVTLNQDRDQEVNGEMIMSLAKVRDGQAHAQVKLRTLFEIMAFEELGEVERKRSDLVRDLTTEK